MVLRLKGIKKGKIDKERIAKGPRREEKETERVFTRTEKGLKKTENGMKRD